MSVAGDRRYTSATGLTEQFDGTAWVQVQTGGVVTGPSLVKTTIEVNLGASMGWRGRFVINDVAITAGKAVLCWQAPGPYTGKGTRTDEAEMQPVSVIAVVSAAGSAIVSWQTPPMITRPTGTASVRIGNVRGNIKFVYLVIS